MSGTKKRIKTLRHAIFLALWKPSRNNLTSGSIQEYSIIEQATCDGQLIFPFPQENAAKEDMTDNLLLSHIS